MSQGGIPMHSKVMLALNFVYIHECLSSGILVGYVSSTFLLLTQTQTPMMGDTHTKYCLSTSGAKRGKFLSLALSDNGTSQQLCYQWKS